MKTVRLQNPGDPTLLEDRAYQALLAELGSRYNIETVEVRFDPAEPFYFTRVTDPGDMPLELDPKGDLLWQPYWAEDWESSRALCRLLLSREIDGDSVLDLGCGLGLTGAVAASRGAKVTLADNAAPALEFSRLNCWRYRELCQFQIVDWKQVATNLEKFEWIVGAEIIYDQDDWADLDKFWKRHLAQKGTVLLCDPFRRTGKDFRNWIQEKNWVPSFTDQLIPEFEKPVNVIELSKP